ncbi:MAG: RNase adapter RapZ [Sphingomonas sp.]
MTDARILFVTGLSGAGKSTALHTLEDLGWEVVDNLPLPLVGRLLAVPPSDDATEGDRPLAVGIDARTRGFDAAALLERAARLRGEGRRTVETLFLDCADAELARRFSETRRRHPLALDRPVADGIAQERALLEPVRRAAEHIVDTSATSTNALQQEMRRRFEGLTDAAPTLTVMSFGFSRGVPREADLQFDMRFLRNPHWDPALRPLTGFDAGVSAYVAADPAYAEAMERIEGLMRLLLPRYAGEGKSYVTVAIGCTGGRHRSVHVAERLAARLREAGFSPTVLHRDLPPAPDSLRGGRRDLGTGTDSDG